MRQLIRPVADIVNSKTLQRCLFPQKVVLPKGKEYFPEKLMYLSSSHDSVFSALTGDFFHINRSEPLET